MGLMKGRGGVHDTADARGDVGIVLRGEGFDRRLSRTETSDGSLPRHVRISCCLNLMRLI